MTKHYFSFFLVLFFTGLVSAQTVTFTENVAPIIFEKCLSCHRSGGIAPFPLDTYKKNVQYASLIDAAVKSKTMPPWPPDVNYKRYAHERLLTDTEISTISDWVNNGQAEGDPNKLPPLPVFPAESELGKEDLKLTIPTYTSTAIGSDIYRCFVIPSGLQQQQFIKALDVIPGNRSIVHHVLVYVDTTGQCRKKDSADVKPGYEGFGGVGSNSARLIGAWVPGSKVSFFPKGLGVRIPKNADIVLQIHYPAGSDGKTDNTSLYLFYTDNTSREVFMDPVLNHVVSLTNGPLSIPPNVVKSFNEQYTVLANVSVLGVAPHMHLIGTKIKSYGLTPAKDTVRFIDIKKWDFHWQGNYTFQRPLKLPYGTKLYADATYDNTAANPHNPSSPPKQVNLGEATTDEMMLVYFQWMHYKTGDENIIMDSTLIPTGVKVLPDADNITFLTCFPNPSDGKINVGFNLSEHTAVNLYVMDELGRKVQSIYNQSPLPMGYQTTSLTTELADGMYFVVLQTDKQVISKKFIVSR